MTISRDMAEANRLNEQGRTRADAGDWDAALSLYRQAVQRAPEFEPAWFNMGLVHKQRGQWAEAADCNQRAAALGGSEGDPAWWNLGIAATALRRWEVARQAWRRFGIAVPEGDGELDMDLGPCPVRIDPGGSAEVVWGRRIDPARVVVMNVPTPDSGRRWKDVVMHDGAPNGERHAFGRVFGVFDELERWQPSVIPTLEAEVTAARGEDAEALSVVFDQAGYAAQDWTTSIRVLCRRCSEGQPSENHDHPVPVSYRRTQIRAGCTGRAGCTLAGRMGGRPPWRSRVPRPCCGRVASLSGVCDTAGAQQVSVPDWNGLTVFITFNARRTAPAPDPAGPHGVLCFARKIHVLGVSPGDWITNPVR